MMCVKSYRFRLYPNHEETERLEWTLEQCRLTYNRLLEELNKQEEIDRGKLQAMLPKWKEENQELKRVYSKTLQYECYRLFSNLRSLSGSKKNGRKVGRLRFKGKGWFKTFTYNQSGFKLVDTDNRLSILHLSKIGEIPIRLHREIEGKIKQITIKRCSSDKWYACIQVDTDKSIPDKQEIETAVGIDVGLSHYVVDSNGYEIGNPRHLRKSLKKLGKEQRRLSRKKKGSKNYKKQKMKVAKVHERVCNRRDDFLHKLSRWYVDNYDLIVTEDLNIDEMKKYNRLSMGISDASWNKLNKMLSYKAENAGKTHIMVNPSGTTQDCSRCGKVVEKTLYDRIHQCTNCGLTIGRDHNSSHNILNRGLSEVGMERAELTPVEIEPLPPIFDAHQKEWQVQSLNQEAPSLGVV